MGIAIEELPAGRASFTMVCATNALGLLMNHEGNEKFNKKKAEVHRHQGYRGLQFVFGPRNAALITRKLGDQKERLRIGGVSRQG